MYKIAIVEDEPEYQSQLKRYIQAYEKEHEDCFDVHVFSDGLDILDNYTADYDIIFMDIQMKHLDGMKTAQSIREMDGNVILIFITNMAQFAIQGYAVDALDYVLKPVSEFAFAQQLGKAVRKLKMRNHDTLTIIQGGNMIRLPISQISYVESQAHNIMIHSERGVYTIRSTMKEMGSKLENQHFSRCNNCFLVNLQHVEQIEQNRVIVAGEELQISRPRKKAFMEALTDYVGGERG